MRVLFTAIFILNNFWINGQTSSDDIIIVDITKQTEFGGPSHQDSLGGHGVMWCDVTGNNYPDVYITMNWKYPNYPYPELFYENQGNYRFPERSKEMGIDDIDGGSHGAVFAGLCAFNNGKEQTKWYKGNTHCHSTISDGDNPPFKVIKAYHDHGYNFLLLTDHNFLVDPDTIKKPSPLRDDFLLISGEEVTDLKSVHTTAFNITKYVPFSNDPNKESDLQKRREEIKSALKSNDSLSKSGMLQNHVNGIINAGGIPILNHPNFSEGLQVSDILSVSNLHHIELYNGHPGVANWGKEGHISVEAKWDSILSAGKIMLAVASDDTHDLETNSPKDANPFRGWIMVNSAELTPMAIHKAVAKGDFYASNSVILKTCEISKKRCSIEIDETATLHEIKTSSGVPRIDNTGQVGFMIEFIGNNGTVLSKNFGLKADYQPKKSDKYVRGRITYCVKTDKGFEKLFAWTQPVFYDKTTVQ